MKKKNIISVSNRKKWALNCQENWYQPIHVISIKPWFFLAQRFSLSKHFPAAAAGVFVAVVVVIVAAAAAYETRQ